MNQEEPSKNISERIFKKKMHVLETSQLITYLSDSQKKLDDLQEREHHAWYRSLKRVEWIWQGLDAIEIESVLARIATSPCKPNNPNWIDTIASYRSGNWSYEWTQQGMSHKSLAKKYQEDNVSMDAGVTKNNIENELFKACLCFSIASYPHLKGDTLSTQAQTLLNETYKETVSASAYILKELEIPYKNKKIHANLHIPHTKRPLPVVIVCGGVDSLQTDMWRLFRDYLAEHEIAMLTMDIPGVGASIHWPLTENSSCLHRAVIEHLANIPWVDQFKVGLIGFRFGGNLMTQLSFLEQEKVQACVSLGAPIHDFLVDTDKLSKMTKMHLDILASRMHKKSIDINSFTKLMRVWSLKSQGILASRQSNVPILALGLEGDPIGSAKDNQTVALYSRGGKAMELKHKSLVEGYDEALTLSVNWLKKALLD